MDIISIRKRVVDTDVVNDVTCTCRYVSTCVVIRCLRHDVIHWTTARSHDNISIFHGCMVWIEKSVTRVTDRHHEACRVMPNSDPE